MGTWQLQEAKSRFSELVAQSLSIGPQWVTRRGEEAVVVLSAADYRLIQQGPSLVKVLQEAPRGEALELQRSAEPIRTIDL
jgi:prevent-host-death family protein